MAIPPQNEEIGGLEAFLAVQDKPEVKNATFIDVRAAKSFFYAHIKDSTSIPFQYLRERSSELPPRGRSVVLVADVEEELADAYSYMKRSGYVVEATLLAGYMTSTKFVVETRSAVSKTAWEPSPLLSEVIDSIEETRWAEVTCKHGKAVDLACGAGRDAVFLARRGWQVLAVDKKLEQLRKMIHMARSYSCANRVTSLCLDLENSAVPVDKSPWVAKASGADLINMARYLNRDMFPVIRNCLAPGGYVVFHSFMEGCAKPHRPKFLLKPGELAQEFGPDHGFVIVLDRVGTIEDGRATSFFVARKPPVDLKSYSPEELAAVRQQIEEEERERLSRPDTVFCISSLGSPLEPGGQLADLPLPPMPVGFGGH